MNGKWSKLGKLAGSSLSALRRDEKGSMATLAALSMTAVVGFGGMGIDMAMWYSQKRVTQNIADAAAVAATYALREGGGLVGAQQAAMEEAVRNGFGGAGDTLTVANAAVVPGATGTPLVNVTIRREVPVFFAGLFLDTDPQVAATATGGVHTLGNICVLGLDENAGRTVEFIGNTYANVGCGVASNSSSGDSLYVSGNATLIANPAQSFGDIVVAGSGELITQLPPMPFSPRVPDPFENRAFPVVSGTCDFNGLVVNSDQTIGPAVAGGSVRICGDLTVKPNISLTLEPGIYFVDGGDVLFQGHVTGDDVTIVLTGSSPSNIGEIDIRAQSVVTLTAPSSGAYQGIVIHQDASAEEDGDNKFNGGSGLTLRGAIYIKNQPITYNGGTDVAGCTQIVARIVKFSGTSYLRNTEALCAAVGLDDSNAQEQVVLLQ
jgi:hypothetical protein